MPVPMVGRSGAVDELRRAWTQVERGGRGRPAVITGEPGTGKSTLVAAVLQATQPEKILAGSARVHSPAPYDWLAAVLASRDIGQLAGAVPEDALAWLAQHPDVPRERYTPEALLRLAVKTVHALVDRQPAVLVVEDLHALDPASLNLVAELAAAGLPALIVVTSRPPEAAVSPELTAQTLARLSGVRGAVRQHLGALDAAQVGQILQHVYAEHAPSSELAEAVHRRTGGNPYRLTELLAIEGAAGPTALAGDQVVAADDSAGDQVGVAGDSAGDQVGVAGDSAGDQVKDLTAREREVLGCLAEGMSNKQIARALGISVRTVTVHVSNLLRKSGAASRTEVALRAVRATTAF